jgi:hypothetical protein
MHHQSGKYYNSFLKEERTGDSRSVLIHRVFSVFANAIFIIVVMGTQRIIPIGPNTHPQNINDTNTINGEMPMPWPMMRGSMKLPITLLMTK